MAGAATLKINIVTDSRQAQKGLQQVAGSVDKMGRRVMGAFALIGGAHIFADVISEAREAAKTTAQTTAVLKSTGKVAGVTAQHVGNLANSLSLVAGVDDELVQQGENLLLTFTNVRNGVGKQNQVFDRATTVALDMSKALGKDLTSSVTMVGKALQDPVKGITALSKAGVNFTKQQKDQIKAMVAAGDTMGAQKLILAELEKEYGGFAAASADPFDKAKVAVKNLEEALGTALMPTMVTVINFVTTHVVPALDAFVGGLTGNTTNVSGFAATMQDFGTKVRTTVTQLGTAAQNAKPLLDAMLKLLSNPTVLTNILSLAVAFKALSVAVDLATVSVDRFKLAWVLLSSPLTIAAALLLAPAFLILQIQGRAKTLPNALGLVGGSMIALGASLVAFFKGVMDVILSSISVIGHGFALMFGLVPGLGNRLRAGVKDFDQWKSGADSSVQGVINQMNHLSASIAGSKTEAERLQAALDALRSKTIEVSVNYRINQPGPAGIRGGGNLLGGATGGIVTRPTFALIGEAGPEMVVPLNRAPGASPLPAGNSNIVVNNYFNGADRAAGAEAGRAVVKSIREYERRSGTGWRR